MYTLKEIADRVEGILVGDELIKITSVEDISIANEKSIAFAFLPKYLKKIKKSKAAAFVVTSKNDIENHSGIIVDNPYLSMIKILDLFDDRPTPEYQISKHSIIHKSVKIPKNLHIGPFSVIEKNVKIGKNVYIGNGVKINAGTIVGDNCILYDNVVLYDNVKIGENTILHSGCVIGCDGFGYFSDNNTHHKIPHIKSVVIGNDVEIGSCSTIDRGSVQDTVIGDFCKLDNQVHLAHNVRLGTGCLLAGGVSVAGSVTIKDFVTIAGKSDIGPHLVIEEKCIIAARSCVLKSLPKNKMYGGNPARPIKEKQKRDALYTRFEILEKKIKKNGFKTTNN